MLACGEGSYGRLGQGNSDDLHTLTVIAALQGTASRSHTLSHRCAARYDRHVAGSYSDVTQSYANFFHGQITLMLFGVASHHLSSSLICRSVARVRGDAAGDVGGL